MKRAKSEKDNYRNGKGYKYDLFKQSWLPCSRCEPLKHGCTGAATPKRIALYPVKGGTHRLGGFIGERVFNPLTFLLASCSVGLLSPVPAFQERRSKETKEPWKVLMAGIGSCTPLPLSTLQAESPCTALGEENLSRLVGWQRAGV